MVTVQCPCASTVSLISTVSPGVRPWIWTVTGAVAFRLPAVRAITASCAIVLAETCLEDRLNVLPSVRRSRTFPELARTTRA